MARRSQAWKDLERQAASALGGKRVSRGDDFSRSDVDVKFDDMPWLKLDCKYRARHAHHSLMEEIIEKYCKDLGDIPVLVTKSHGQRGAYATIPLDYLRALLNLARTRTNDKQEADVHPASGV